MEKSPTDTPIMRTPDELLALFDPFSAVTVAPSTASSHPISPWAVPAVILERASPEERLALLGNVGPLFDGYQQYLLLRRLLGLDDSLPAEAFEAKVRRRVRLRLAELHYAAFRDSIVSAEGGYRFLASFDETLHESATKHQGERLVLPDGNANSWGNQLREDLFRANLLCGVTMKWGGASDSERQVYVEALADSLILRLRGGVRDRLRQAVNEARSYGDGADERARQLTHERQKRIFLEEAIALVLSRRDESQRHRFGTIWARDGEGHFDTFIPWLAGWLDYWDWFVDEASKAIEAIILERPYPSTSDGKHKHEPYEPNGGLDSVALVPLDSTDRLMSSHGLESDNTLSTLLDRDETSDLVRLLRERLRPREREVFDMLEREPDLTAPQVAERLRITPGNVRQIRGRIKKTGIKLLKEMYRLGV